MLWFYLIFPVILVSGLQAEYKAQDYGKWQEVVSFIENRCAQNAESAEAFNSFMKFLGEFDECLKNSKIQMEPYDDKKFTDWKDYTRSIKWCTDYPQIYYSCIEDALHKLEPCLKTEEQFFTETFLISYNASFQFICHDGPENTAEFVINSFENKCPVQTGKMLDNAIHSCIPNLNFTKNLSKSDFILRKSDIYGYLTNAKDCVIGSLNEQCPNDDSFTRLVEKFFDGYIKANDVTAI